MKIVESAEGIALDELDERRTGLDRRKASRKKVLRGGRTYWPNGDSSDCIILNLSERGAHLEIRGPLPNLFDLAMVGHHWRRSCTVVWRKANRVGVKFEGQSSVASSRPTRRIDKFSGYVDACQALAARTVVRSDRELMLEMAEAWVAIIRQLRRLQRSNQ
jgi:hypothetical protein